MTDRRRIFAYGATVSAAIMGFALLGRGSVVDAQSVEAEDVEAEGVASKLPRKFRDKCDRDKRSYSRRECREWLEGLNRVQIRLINREYAIDRFDVRRESSPIQSEGAISVEAAGCFETPNREDATLRAYNQAGGELFWVRQTIHWCGDGNRNITSFRPRNIDFQIASWNILWKYEGVDNDSSREGIYKDGNGEFYEAKTRIKFEACLTPQIVGLLCDTAFPTFDQIGWPNGRYAGDKYW